MEISIQVKQLLANLPEVGGELSDSKLAELKKFVRGNQQLRDEAIEIVTDPQVIESYEHLSAIDDYFPSYNGPYNILAEIGRGSRKAVEFCLKAVMEKRGFSLIYAIETLPRISTQEFEEEIISGLVFCLERTSSSYSLDIYSQFAVTSLLKMGEKGVDRLKAYAHCQNEERVDKLRSMMKCIRSDAACRPERQITLRIDMLLEEL